MTVSLYVNHMPMEFKQWKFPGGEVGVKLLEIIPAYSSVEVQVSGVPTSDDIFIAMNLLDAVNRFVTRNQVTLHFNYLPYARQDRVCAVGESFALQVFIKMIMSMQHTFWRVTFDDMHSKVAIEEFEKIPNQGVVFKNYEQHFFTDALPKFDVIIAPDKGATEKAKHTQPETMHIFLDKVRVDGKVQYENYAEDTIVGKACIVDDIGDGGATFLSAAEMLRKTQPRMQELSLYVTHGIFSKGFDIVKESFDNVYVSNPMTLEAQRATLIPF